MPRLEDTGNTDFVRYLGPHTLTPQMDTSQGDPLVRTPCGKKIISQRGRLINRENIANGGANFDAPEETKVEQPSRYQAVLDDRNLHQRPARMTSMWAK